MKHESLYSIITKAVKYISEKGYTNGRMIYWSSLIRNYFSNTSKSKDINFRRILISQFSKITNTTTLKKLHKDVPIYTLEMIKPSLRTQLEKRIFASADLIKINRKAAIEKTIQRFSGWCTSIPETGSDVVDKMEIKSNILKPSEQLQYEERRVAIDQGHKMLDAVNETISKQTGAIAAIWRSNYKQSGYDFREDHKERNDKIYTIKGNWAIEKGLMKVGIYGYTDQITRPAEEINCRCYYVYVNSLRDFPVEMLTQKGKDYLGIK